MSLMTYREVDGKMRSKLYAPNTTKKKRNELKQKLPYLVAAGTFRGNTRKKETWESDSGLVTLDIDDIPTERAKEIIESEARRPETVAAFLSPSGCAKLIYKTTPKYFTQEDYLERWTAIKDRIETEHKVKVDPSGKDSSRACFVSYDPDAYFNPNADALPKIEEDFDFMAPPSKAKEPPKPTAPQVVNVVPGEAMTPNLEAIDEHLSKIQSIEYKHGNKGMMNAARAIVSHFNVSDPAAQMEILSNWNKAKANPVWTQHELERALNKVRSTPSTVPIGCLVPHQSAKGDKITAAKKQVAEGLSVLKEHALNTDWQFKDLDNFIRELSQAVHKTANRKMAMTYFKDTVERCPVWLWRGYILQGATHVLGGKQGTSKGLFTVDIAARLSRGDLMPDGSGDGVPKKILFITREDDPEMTLLPRLRVAGANMANVAWSNGDFTDGQNIESMALAAEHIEKRVDQEKIDLDIIDPLGAWVEDDMNNGQAVRAVIDPINRMVMKTHCSVIFVAHLKKNTGKDADAMDAFSGSAQVTAAVRVAMLISPLNGEASLERIVQIVKTNFKRPKGDLVYSLDLSGIEPSTEDPPTLKWRDASGADRATLAQANKTGAGPLVSGGDIYDLIPVDHKRFEEVLDATHKQLLGQSAFKKATKTAVKTAMIELISDGKIFEGKGRTRTVGRTQSPVRQDDLALEFFLNNPLASIRAGSEAVRVSIGTAQKGKKAAESILACDAKAKKAAEELANLTAAQECSIPSVQCIDVESLNSEHQPLSISALSVQSLPLPL
jgi:hypothetical protein